MRRPLIAALLLLGAADKLPPPDANSHLPKLTPAEQAGEEMVSTYQEFCLSRFPSVAALKEAIPKFQLTPAKPADAAEALQGRDGKAFNVPTHHTHFTLGITRYGCVVTGIAGDDEPTRTIFNIAVQGFAAMHDVGKMDFPALRRAEIGGRPARLQLIGTLGEKNRQAFVNMALVREDGQTLVRLAREFQPPPEAAPAPAKPDAAKK